jgi:hypothetical protein
MTIVETTQPLTARALLFQDATGAGRVEVLADKLNEHDVARSALGGLHRLSGSALGTVNREIATIADGLLDLDLGGSLVSAWRKYSDLTRAAERTLAAPDSEEIVALASHRVIWTYRPYIDLLVDGKRIATIAFELRVLFDLHRVVAVVRLGGLVALRGGDCVIAAALTVEGQQVAQHQGRVDLALVVQVDPDIPLLGENAATTASLRRRPHM